MFSFLYYCHYFYRTFLEHPEFLMGSVLLIFLVCCAVLLCVFMLWVSCVDVRYNFCIKTMFGSYFRIYLQLLVRGFMSYLRYLCLFAYSGVQYILCCVFSSCVLYVVRFSGLPHWYYLTFIRYFVYCYWQEVLWM
jgi:hypothetical protein